MYKYLAKNKTLNLKEKMFYFDKPYTIANIHLLRDYTKLAMLAQVMLNKQIKNYHTK
ncbi:MAG: hypothetical protein CM15mP23_15550 [Cryomorphaceae bacterium]|nr:MAG: hypothetical protein CM15mP23_15550 [Cryomorphaceae bacterium]